MDRKYQIFVSSTYEDLKPEREAVIKAILEMGHIPVGMEMFSAADEEQWQIICSHIDRSDYYVVIIAHRYGSMSGGISYTKKEYDYAISVGVPVLGFVIEETVLRDPSSVETDKRKLLEEFETQVRDKPVSFWSSKDHLYGQVAIALSKQITTRPRPGWVRGSAAMTPEVTAEIARLSHENSELRDRLQAPVVPDLAFELLFAKLVIPIQGALLPGYSLATTASFAVHPRNNVSASFVVKKQKAQMTHDKVSYEMQGYSVRRTTGQISDDGVQLMVTGPGSCEIAFGLSDPLPVELKEAPWFDFRWKFEPVGFDVTYDISNRLSFYGKQEPEKILIWAVSDPYSG